jgi:hypothetical protein
LTIALAQMSRKEREAEREIIIDDYLFSNRQFCR